MMVSVSNSRSKQFRHSDIFFSRVAVLTAFLFIFLGAIVVRLVRLQIIDGSENRKIAEQQHSVYRKLLPTRGDIKISDKFSSGAYPVATNIQKYFAYAVPQEAKNATYTAETLEPVLGITAHDLLEKITDYSRKNVPIKKQLSDEETEKIKALKLPGIYLDSEDSRVYPQGQLLAQVLGFVGYKDDRRLGLYGLERFFDDALTGKSGSLSQEKDTSGAWIFGSRRDYVPEQDGDNLVLTIDKTIQFQAENILGATVKEHGANSGSIVVMNPKTGAVLAMANYPSFDPNQYNKVSDPSVFLNEAVTGNYEPGSTFKAITMAAAIDAGKITQDTTYTDTGSVAVDKYVIKNAEPGARGVQTMTQALDFSLNTGAIFAESQLGNEKFLEYVNTFGFGRKTGIELPESSGNLKNLSGNIQVNYYTASFGQGITVTPLQMIAAYAALANRGKLMRPYIVASKISPDGSVTDTKPYQISQVITPKTASIIDAMLVDVVENGFGKKAAVPGYYIAGKTGTAQVPKENGKGYDPTDNIGSFIGFGPVEDPQFVMLVRIDHPRDVKFAESTAVPAFGQMAKFILDYYSVAPTRQVSAKK